MTYAANQFRPGAPGDAVEASLRRDRSGSVSTKDEAERPEIRKPLKGLRVRVPAKRK